MAHCIKGAFLLAMEAEPEGMAPKGLQTNRKNGDPGGGRPGGTGAGFGNRKSLEFFGTFPRDWKK